MGLRYTNNNNNNDYNPTYGGSESNDTPEKEIVETTQEETKSQKRKKQKKIKEEKPKSNSHPFAFVHNRRFKLIVGMTFTLFSVLLLIASISYIKNGMADQSLVANNSILTNAEKGEISNHAGSFGAAFAETFFNQGFGIGSYFLILLTFLIGLKFLGGYKARFSSTIAINLLATITVSSIAGLLTLGGTESFFLLGGEHGIYLNQYLIKLIGVWGAISVNILLVVSLAALCLNSIVRIINKYRHFIRKRKQANLEAQQREAEERLRILAEQEEEEKSKSKNIDFNTPEPAPQEPEEVNPLEQSTPTTKNNNFLCQLKSTFSKKKVEQEPEPQPSETESDLSRFMPPAIEEKEQEETPAVAEDPVVALETPAKEETPLQEETTEKQKEDIPMTVIQNTIEAADKIEEKPFDPTAELSKYKFPTLDLLKEVPAISKKTVDIKEQEENKDRITKTLNDYGIEIRSIEVCVGPTVTLYEIIPAEGVRIAKIKRLEDDIALSLAALGIRIIAPIPGKGTIGIEVPNKDPQTVWMRSIIGSKKFQECKYELPIALGSTIDNDVFIADLTKMPHLLVAGATGQGKSVGLNAIITSLLYKKHPSQLKFVMIDPKTVEFSLYGKLEKHYLAKLPEEDDAIVTDMNKAFNTLNALVQEMEDRLKLLNAAEVRNIQEYNNKFINHRLNPEKGHKFLPYIVVIVDEYADLMMTTKEVEIPIARLAQKARAIGIHVIIATQRPSTNVITGLIKNNFPSRIAFRVTQMVDSRTIIDRPGANQLIGRGDMLIMLNNEITRVQCAFVDTPEVEAITKYISNQIGYDHAYELPEYEGNEGGGNGGNGSMGSVSDRDELFCEAAEFIVGGGNTASTSSIQRRFSIGYPRAGKIMDQLEAAGIVGPATGGKPRQVLIDLYQLNQYLNK